MLKFLSTQPRKNDVYLKNVYLLQTHLQSADENLYFRAELATQSRQSFSHFSFGMTSCCHWMKTVNFKLKK